MTDMLLFQLERRGENDKKKEVRESLEMDEEVFFYAVILLSWTLCNICSRIVWNTFIILTPLLRELRESRLLPVLWYKYRPTGKYL